MAPAGHLDPLGEEMSSAQVGVQGGGAAVEVDEGGEEKNRNRNATVGGLRSRVDNLAQRLGNQQKRTRLLNAAVCSDILLLRTPFFFGYALGRFSYSFSWMFLVCQISNATFTASRSRRSDKRLTFNMNSLSSAAANAATCIEWNLHVLAVLILCWILGQHPQSKTSGRPPALAISNPKIIRSPPPSPLSRMASTHPLPLSSARDCHEGAPSPITRLSSPTQQSVYFRGVSTSRRMPLDISFSPGPPCNCTSLNPGMNISRCAGLGCVDRRAARRVGMHR